MSQNSEVMVIRNTGNLPQVIEENSLFSYFEKIRKFPVLSENEETRLIRDFKENGDLDRCAEADYLASASGRQNCVDLQPLRTADGRHCVRGQYRADAGRQKV